jgi:hypothetical protein
MDKTIAHPIINMSVDHVSGRRSLEALSTELRALELSALLLALSRFSSPLALTWLAHIDLLIALHCLWTISSDLFSAAPCLAQLLYRIPSI